MKLIKAYVSSFGVLKDFEYDFNDGINTIKQDNGFGKTTFATFIKCMFYGLSKNGNGIDKDERKKYKPWNSTEKFGGYLIFERANQSFKVERFFGNKASEDTFRLTDVKTGKEYNVVDNLGDKMFKIDEEGFLSTIYFSQKDFEVSSNTSIVAKFNEVYGVQNTELFDNAISKIDAKIKKYKTTGERGIIPDLRNRINDVDERLNRISKIESGVSELNNQYDLTQSETTVLENKLKVLREKQILLSKAEAIKLKRNSLSKLKENKDALILDKSKAERIINGNNLTENILNDYKNGVKVFEQLNAKKETLKGLMGEQKATPNKFDFRAVFMGIFAIIFAVLAVVFRLNTPIFIGGLVLSGMSLLGFVYILCTSKKISVNSTDNISAQYKEVCEKLSECKTKLDAFFSLFILPLNAEYNDALSILEKALSVESLSSVELEKTDKEISELEKELSGVKEINIDDDGNIENDIAILENTIRGKRNELASLKSRIDSYKQEIDSKVDLENLKSELLDKKIDAEVDSELLSLTLEYLKKADTNLKVKMRYPLELGLNKYLNLISGKNVNAKIDVDLGITLEEKGAERVPEYYSKGYQNTFSICKRLAISEVLFTDEKPFIILDDPFYNLDDSKIEHALDLLKNISKECQILYLVCHNSRSIDA